MSRHRLVVALAALISLACDDPPLDQDADENGESTSTESESTESESTSEGESESSESESSESESSESESSESDGEPSDCPFSTDIAGNPASLPTSPDCEIVCPSGWSNPTAPLEVAWTLDLVPFDGMAVALAPGEGSSVLAIAGRSGSNPMQLTSISLAGELQWVVWIEEVQSIIQAATSDSAKTVYVSHIIYNPISWVAEARISAISPTGEYQWTTALGNAGSMVHAMVPRSEGTVVLMGAPGVGLSFDTDLVALSSEGVVEWSRESLQRATALGVGPNGELVVASGDEYAIYTSSGEDVEMGEQVFDADWLSRARFGDGQTIVQTGHLVDDFGAADGLIAWQPLGGRGWFERYQMGDVVCDGQVWTGIESLVAFTELADGGLVVVGQQGFNGFPEPWPGYRPFVGHIDAGGDLIAADLGTWNGVGKDVMVGDDGSLLVLIQHESEDTAYQVRKYLLE